MINYELASELKDAGFPQVFPDGRIAAVNANNSDYAYPPTLSELIEACGDGFLSLFKREEDRWYAYASGTVGQLIEPAFGGSTPEIAVAKLWLALNPKPN